MCGLNLVCARNPQLLDNPPRAIKNSIEETQRLIQNKARAYLVIALLKTGHIL